MLAIARALMTNPALLLLDEPLEGLAPIIVEELTRTIRRLADEGVGFILVEQHTRLALGLARQAIILERGRIVFRGASQEPDRRSRRSWCALSACAASAGLVHARQPLDSGRAKPSFMRGTRQTVRTRRGRQVSDFLTTWAALTFNGISFGMILFLISSGLTVTLGVMRLVNLAHCGFAMIGGYIAMAAVDYLGFGLLAVAAGRDRRHHDHRAVIERTLFRWVYGVSRARPDPDDDRPRLRDGGAVQHHLRSAAACAARSGLAHRQFRRSAASSSRSIAVSWSWCSG